MGKMKILATVILAVVGAELALLLLSAQILVSERAICPPDSRFPLIIASILPAPRSLSLSSRRRTRVLGALAALSFTDRDQNLRKMFRINAQSHPWAKWDCEGGASGNRRW